MTNREWLRSLNDEELADEQLEEEARKYIEENVRRYKVIVISVF